MNLSTTLFAVPDSWTSQGGTSQSAETYRRIRAAMDDHIWPTGMTWEMYLQGSYRNHTNIRGDSDVDIVAETTSTFYHGIEHLTDAEKALFHTVHGTATYSLADFKAEVVSALTAQFGSKVSLGRKCINIGGEEQRLNADVVAAATYRRYGGYSRPDDSDHEDGIRFYVEPEGRWIINFPKHHFENGARKNEVASGHYKPIIRAYKNARNHLVDRGLLAKGQAPSYFIEGLLYNVNYQCFGSNVQESFKDVMATLVHDYKNDRMRQYGCQNGMSSLFGTTPEQWDLNSAATYINGLLKLRK